MSDFRMGAAEFRFAELIWASEPLKSGELVALCQQELNWKKSTTYTVLKKLCQRGLFVNEGGVVRSLISREDHFAMQSEQFVADTFAGSLPAFLAAFTRRKALSPDEIAQIRQMIETYEEG